MVESSVRLRRFQRSGFFVFEAGIIDMTLLEMRMILTAEKTSRIDPDSRCPLGVLGDSVVSFFNRLFSTETHSRPGLHGEVFARG